MLDEPLVLEDAEEPLEDVLDALDALDVLAADPLATEPDEDEALPAASLVLAFDDAVSAFLPLSAGTEL